VEADLLEHYRVDILDLGTERLSWGRLWRLVDQLPPASRTGVALYGEGERWSATEHLLASVYDAVVTLDYHLRAVNTRKGRKAETPELMWRPGRPVKRIRSTLAPAEMARRLRAMRERHGD
jgi:hypothetical protein